VERPLGGLGLVELPAHDLGCELCCSGLCSDCVCCWQPAARKLKFLLLSFTYFLLTRAVKIFQKPALSRYFQRISDVFASWGWSASSKNYASRQINPKHLWVVAWRSSDFLSLHTRHLARDVVSRACIPQDSERYVNRLDSMFYR
jgi:hypothetical protein